MNYHENKSRDWNEGYAASDYCSHSSKREIDLLKAKLACLTYCRNSDENCRVGYMCDGCKNSKRLLDLVRKR